MKLLPMLGLNLLLSAGAPATEYFISPSGNDGAAGAIDAPFFNVSKAVTLAAAGDTIWMRGGIYNYTNVNAIAKSGAAGAPIRIWAYTNEHPLLDYSKRPYTGNTDTNISFWLKTNANWWYFKGLEIAHAADSAIKIQGCFNIVEFCTLHHNSDTGVQIGLGDGDDNDGSLAASNQVINCDAYLNYDPHSSGGNADGIDCKLSPGKGNIIKGCRSWENSDDGYDFFKSNYQIIIEDCWTWHNGDPALFGTGSAGNAEGFKLGGDSSFHGPHLVIRCIAFNNVYGGSSAGRAFMQNDNTAGLTLLNCLSFSNNYNYALNNDISESHMVTNCVGFAGVTKNNDFNGNTIQVSNSWNFSTNTLLASAADYIDLTETAAMAPREADGSLPNNGFGRLVAGSDLMDKGAKIGLPYNGLAPDLGPFEFGSGPPQTPSLFDAAHCTLGPGTNGFSLRLTGLTGHGPVILFGSSNLLTWLPVLTNPPVTGSTQLVDSSASSRSWRFYRAAEQ